MHVVRILAKIILVIGMVMGVSALFPIDFGGLITSAIFILFGFLLLIAKEGGQKYALERVYCDNDVNQKSDHFIKKKNRNDRLALYHIYNARMSKSEKRKCLISKRNILAIWNISLFISLPLLVFTVIVNIFSVNIEFLFEYKILNFLFGYSYYHTSLQDPYRIIFFISCFLNRIISVAIYGKPAMGRNNIPECVCYYPKNMLDLFYVVLIVFSDIILFFICLVFLLPEGFYIIKIIFSMLFIAAFL